MSLNVGELVAQLTLDDGRFVTSLRKSDKQMRDLGDTAKKEAQRIDRSFKDAGDGAERLGRDAKDAGRDLDKLGRHSRDVDKVTDAAKDAAEEVSGIGGAATGAGDALSALGGALSSKAGGEGGANFVAGFTDKIQGLGGKGGPVAASLVGVAVVGLAAGTVLAKAIQDGMAREKAMDLTQAQLGVDDATMQRIGHAAGAAYTDAFGESVEANMTTARDAIKSGLLDPDATTAEIQQVIEQLDALSQVMGVDVPQAAMTAGQLVRTGLADNGKEAFDLLTVGAQKVETEAGDIADVFTSSSATLKQFGLDGQTSLGMFNQAIEAGAPSADFLVGALEELAGNAADSADTFAELGLNGEEMARKLTGGGEQAAQGLDQLLDALRGIEDPAKRANAFVALFGEEATAMQDVLMAVDPSSAIAGLGNLSGAAQDAATTIHDNAATRIDSAFRSIETSADDIKLALAEAFGPALTDLANWVTTHKPELIEFFTGLADAGLITLEAMMRFTSGSLRAWSVFAEGVGGMMASVLDSMNMGVLAAANLADAMGFDGQAENLRGLSDDMNGWSQAARNAGNQARDWADTIDAGIPVIQNMRGNVVEAGHDAAESARLMQALGNTVVTGIPSNKSITISDNSPETVSRLEALGFKVETTPSGITVTATTGEAQATLDGFLAQERTMTVKVRAEAASEAYADNLAADVANGGRVHYADGGIHDRQAQIRKGQGRGITWAEEETGWEAYIPGALSKRGRAEQVLGETARRFGLGVVKMADGGITGFDGDAAANFFAAHNGEPYDYGALDCSGLLSEGFNKATGQSVRFTTASDFASLGWAPGYDPTGFSIGTNNGVGINGHMAGTLYGTNVESDGSNGIQWGGTANGATDFPEVWHWPGATRGDDPSTEQTGSSSTPDAQAGMVTATTDSGATLSTDGTRVFVTNWPGEKTSEVNERKEVFSAGVKVFANGGLDNLPTQAGIYPDGANVVGFAEKGTGGEGYVPLGQSKRPRSVQITKAIAHRFGYTLVPMADGGLSGFGGYQGADQPSLDIPLSADGWAGMTGNQRRAAAYNLGALGIGGAFALASGFDENGALTGKFDTGANSHPGLEKGFELQVDLLERIAKAAENGEPVNVEVEIDRGNRTADIAIMKGGL